MKRKWIASTVLACATAAAITYTVLQPNDSVAQTIHAQYLESEQLTFEEVKSDGTNMWSMWKRDLSPKEADLPIASNQAVTFLLGYREATMNVRILDGQLTVTAKEIAQFLQIEREFYTESLILQLAKGDQTLVFRGNTEIVYENGVKTPSSAQALQKGQDLLVPINVVANGFGYKLKWNEQQRAIVLEEATDDNER